MLLQTSMRVQTRKMEAAGDDSRSQVVGILRRISKNAKSYALMQLVASAQSDPFGKIRGLIEEMIAKLTKEAAEEADQKSFCDEEISESKAKQVPNGEKLHVLLQVKTVSFHRFPFFETFMKLGEEL